MTRLHAALLLLATLCCTTVTASDLAREQRIAEQIVDAIFDGEPLELEAQGHNFLAIHMESSADTPRGAAIILHGRGLHPDWETVVKPLRTALPEQGWETLALQMPVLEKEAKYYDYEAIFAEAHPRIDAAIAWLRERGIERIVLIAHSCGAHMAMSWVRNGGTGIDAYVGIGMGATDYQQPMRQPFPLDRLTLPVLDLYGERDYPAVLAMAPERLKLMRAAGNRQSTQRLLPGADHYYAGHSAALTGAVTEWLDGLTFD